MLFLAWYAWHMVPLIDSRSHARPDVGSFDFTVDISIFGGFRSFSLSAFSRRFSFSAFLFIRALLLLPSLVGHGDSLARRA